MCHTHCSPWALGPTLPNNRSDGNEKPPALRQRNSGRCNWRKPESSNEDPEQPKINQLFNQVFTKSKVYTDLRL